jgi:hypothetical protein
MRHTRSFDHFRAFQFDRLNAEAFEHPDPTSQRDGNQVNKETVL